MSCICVEKRLSVNITYNVALDIINDKFYNTKKVE